VPGEMKSFWADKDCSKELWDVNPTESEIVDLIDELINELKNDWSKWGDVSEWARKSMIRRLNKLRRLVKMPKRIDFKMSSRGNTLFLK
jgi:hypothetical protein